jgi:hypothetical protein
MARLMIGFFIAYLVLHFLAYAFGLRFLIFFSQEKNIFAYHFFSCLLMGIVLIGCLLFFPLRETIALTIGSASLHGIYSISFLELWSLSQAGYSLRILFNLQKKEENAIDSNHLKSLGKVKIEQRIQNLQRLGLIAFDAGKFYLTVKGRIVSLLLKFIIILSASERLEETK